MRNIRTILAVAASLTLGASLFDASPARAELGAGGAVIGGGGNAIGAAPPATGTEGKRAAAPRMVGNCATNRTAFRTQDNLVSTNSQIAVTMPNTHFAVTHAAGCLIVDFAGMIVTNNTDNQMVIRAFIQGIGPAEPMASALGRPSVIAAYETRSMRFVFPNVPAGKHTVRIDWWTETGGLVHALHRTLTVQYRQ